MGKKILSIVLVAVMLFSFTSICVSAEETEPAPELSYTLTHKLSIDQKQTLSVDGALSSGFKVDIEVIKDQIVALGDAKVEPKVTITEIRAQRQGDMPWVVYDEENPEDFYKVFELIAETEEDKPTKPSLPMEIDFRIDFKDKEVFGILDYELTINGFAQPPSLGIDLGDSLPVPTPIVAKANIPEFPTLQSYEVKKASTKMEYLDSEMIELDGIELSITTSAGETGIVKYGPTNQHLFTTVPAKDQKLTVDVKEISTYFFGDINISTVPVRVEHDMAKHPVNITTDKYTDNKPGYHATICNGCGKRSAAEPHRVDPDAWVSNNDATFTSNGTASQPCLDCGATLTKDVLGSAQYNVTLSNYHFLLVIFDYINLVLKFIDAAFPNR